jgi:hypothetical protein
MGSGQRSSDSHRQGDKVPDARLMGNASFYGPKGERLDNLGALMNLDKEGMPNFQSVTLFLPNEHVKEPTIIGGPTHMQGVVVYSKMLEDAGVGGISERDKVMERCAVDLVVRPHRRQSNMCVRTTVAPRENWPEMVEYTIGLFSSLGLPEERIRILDFSQQIVDHELRTGQMGKLYKIPRTVVEREHFIDDSQVMMGSGMGEPLRHLRAYYGLTGQRQILHSDFEHFIDETIKQGGRRGNLVKALEHLVQLAGTENKFGVRHLEFFKADATKFTADTIKRTINAIGKRGHQGEIGTSDIEDLVNLQTEFKNSVPDEYRSYDPLNEGCREELLQKLLGGFAEGIEIPGLKVSYLGRGGWVNGPVMEDGRIKDFSEDTPSTLRNICHALTDRFADLEYMAPYQSVGSGSIREIQRDPNREVYLIVIKRKSSPFPMIYHLRRVSEIGLEQAQDLLDRITTARESRIDIPETQVVSIADTSGEKQFLLREFDHIAIPVEKLGLDRHKRKLEVIEREHLLGYQAGLNAFLGRVSHFADGGEVMRMFPTGWGYKISLLEPDGLFQDVKTPIADSLDIYACHLARNMLKCHVMGINDEGVEEVRTTFVNRFMKAVDMMRQAYELDPDHYRKRFSEDKPIHGELMAVFKRLRKTSITEVGGRLTQRTHEIYEKLNPVFKGLDSHKERREVAEAMDQLVLVHPDNIDDTINVISSDDSFPTLSARDRQDRLNMIRLDCSARECNLTLAILNGYVTALLMSQEEYAFAAFEDEAHKKFPGLNLRGMDAKLIFKVFYDADLLSEYKSKGYITD